MGRNGSQFDMPLGTGKLLHAKPLKSLLFFRLTQPRGLSGPKHNTPGAAPTSHLGVGQRIVPVASYTLHVDLDRQAQRRRPARLAG
jgi:hypothetical protein